MLNRLRLFIKNKKKLLLVIIISVFIIICFTKILKVFLIKSEKQENSIFQKNELVDFKDYINNRCILQKLDSTFIGKNEKELENGYFDVSILKNEKFIEINFNKISKEENFKNIDVDKEYLYEIINYFSDRFMLNLSENIKFELAIIISDKYINYRQNKADNTSNEYSFDTKYKFNFLVKDNMLNLKVIFK